MRLLLCFMLVVSSACGDDDGSMDAGADASLDGSLDAPGSVPDTGGPDAPVVEDGGTDAGPLPTCADALAERTVELAPGFLETQIHPYAVYDGEQIWVTLTAHVEGEEGLDVFLTTLDCAGVARGLAEGAPAAVHENSAPNDIDGTIAIQGDRVLVAWQLDEGEGVQTAVRAFDRTTRSALGPETRVLTTRGGAPVEGTTWFPVLAPRPALADVEPGFWLAGTRGIDEAMAFQAYLQVLTLDGALIDEASEPLPAVGVTQSFPGLAVDASGPHLVFTGEPTDEPVQAYYAAPGEEPRTLDDTVVSTTDPALAVGDEVFVAYAAGARRVSLRAIGAGAGGADVAAEVTRNGVGPYLAVDPEDGSRGAILYARNLSGFSATELIVQGFAFVDGAFELGAEVRLPLRDPVPVPYRPSILALEGGYYLAVWSEGRNPDFVARGHFLRP